MRNYIALIASALLIAGGQSHPAVARPVSPSSLPSYVPQGARKGEIWYPQMPQNWNSITPWGQAINPTNQSGIVEIRTFEMTCLVNGRAMLITTGLDRLEAGIYLANPWFYNDQNTLIRPQRTANGTVQLPVPQGRVTHWWIRTPRPTVPNARNCTVTSQMRMSAGVLASIGGDYWVNRTTGWQGQDVANIPIGISNWHNSEGGWQTLIMAPSR
ncbi:MAG: hypothetical protein MH252_05845 [Thermosynechococcaceae cyanobacterium MS004]|nr:hypothetical protein [Thermosynechococcaceae cyanobacterium MS004]